MPLWIELPIPTPPPWWTLTQVAPAAVLRSAFRIGQSAIASEPSRIASVSRYGEATEPGVEVIAADHDGRRDAAGADELVDREARPGTVAVAEPADPGRQALERDLLGRHREPALQEDVVGEQPLQLAIDHLDVGGVAGEHRPPERADAAAEERPDIGRDEARV